VLRTIVTAGARLHSYADAAFALSLTGLSISARHVQQLTARIGDELAAARDAKARSRRQRQAAPAGGAAPEVVAVEVDGGRLRTRQPGCGPGVHQPEHKEDKIACLVTLHSDEHADDPQPQPPPPFLRPRRVQRLVRQMHGPAADGLDPPDEPAAAADRPADPVAGSPAPRRLVRTCVASMADSRSFGPLVAGEAHARNFYAARRRAFVADGQAYNWAIQRGYFPDFVPVVDFLHVLCYLYAAAAGVGADEPGRWSQYVAWLTDCWQGRAAAVLAELEHWQAVLGPPPPGEELAAADPRRVVAEAVSYLGHNVGRMDYPSYRRQGLPTTSSLAESLVGEFNARVKGPQKAWNRPGGAEAILQVRAALLSEDGRLERHFAERPGNPYRRRAA
jgi:hypothetical protein